MKPTKEPMILGYAQIMVIANGHKDESLRDYGQHVKGQNRRAWIWRILKAIGIL